MNYRQAIFSIPSSRFSENDAPHGNFIPKIIPFRVLSVPNFANSDYDASGNDTSGFEVSDFDATFRKCTAKSLYFLYKSLLICKTFFVKPKNKRDTYFE